MEPLYWWLIGAGVIVIGALKLYVFQKWMTKRQQEAEKRREAAGE